MVRQLDNADPKSDSSLLPPIRACLRGVTSFLISRFAASFGLSWAKIGTTKPVNSDGDSEQDDELKNDKLAAALCGKTNFTSAEWRQFEIDIQSLRPRSFIKSLSNEYFKPSVPNF
eukprot:6771179-Prymnesium_polylepis.1